MEDSKSFEAAVLKLAVERQHALLEHAPAVGRYLQVIGLHGWMDE